MRHSVLRVTAAAVTLAAVTACGGDAVRPSARGTGTGSDVAPGSQASAPTRSDARRGASATATAATPGAAKPSAAASSAPPVGGTKPAAPASGAPASQGGQQQPQQATAAELPIDAKVDPGCVAPGGLASIVITTKPQASVAYLAVYAGDKSGAEAPFGHGYGGNEGGQTDAQGTWRASWTVRPDAPRGNGYIVVVASHSGKSRETRFPFSVGVREAGGCGS